MSRVDGERASQQDDAAQKAASQVAWDVIEAKRRAHPELRGTITLEGLRAVAQREGVFVSVYDAGASVWALRMIVAYYLVEAWLANTAASPVRGVFNLLAIPENILEAMRDRFLPTATEPRGA